MSAMACGPSLSPLVVGGMYCASVSSRRAFLNRRSSWPTCSSVGSERAARPVAGCRSWLLALLFGRLGFVPQAIHLGQRHLAEGAAAAPGGFLHVDEPFGEAVGGAAQRLLRIHFDEPGKVHQREQEIADFVLEPSPGLLRSVLRHFGRRVSDFAQLLVDLADDLSVSRLVVRPVKADAGC